MEYLSFTSILVNSFQMGFSYRI